MSGAMNQMKMLNALRKAQKELKNEIVEIEAGDGAVVVQINGELKVKKVTIDPAKVDLDGLKTASAMVMLKPKKSPPTK